MSTGRSTIELKYLNLISNLMRQMSPQLKFYLIEAKQYYYLSPPTRVKPSNTLSTQKNYLIKRTSNILLTAGLLNKT